MAEVINTKQEGKKLIITVDLSGKGEVSSSGKSLVIASTRGNMKLADGLFMGLNIYRKLDTPVAPKVAAV